MTQPVLEVGEKVHIITRRHFKEDIRRHFAGTVLAVSGALIRVEGYSFIVSAISSETRRLSGARTRLFGLTDSSYILNVLPPSVMIDRLQYQTVNGRLMMADSSSGFSLEVNEHN